MNKELKGAIFSEDRRFRYSLWRVWNRKGPQVLFICLNPSIADEVIDDPTQRRCRRFAQDWGYGGYIVGNIFAYVSTDPKQLKSVKDPIGPENNAYLLKMHKDSDLTIVAWGNWGELEGRGNEVYEMLSKETGISGLKLLECLGVNRNGSPRHPLYLRADTKPSLFIL